MTTKTYTLTVTFPDDPELRTWTPEAFREFLVAAGVNPEVKVEEEAR